MIGFWDDAEIIHTYSREQALEDGVLVDVSEMAREAGFTVPVAVTRAVWRLIEPTEQERTVYLQDESGRLWDVLWMASLAARRTHETDTNTRRGFYVWFHLRGRGARNEHRTERLDIHSGPGDDGEHVITILLPHED